MHIHYDPDEYESVHTRRTCPYHEKHPGDYSFAGCTCSFSISQRRRSPEDYNRIKAERQRKADDEILRRAEAIKLMRKHEANQ